MPRRRVSPAAPRILLLLFALPGIAACAARRDPATIRVPERPASVRALARDVDTLLASPVFAQGLVGMRVDSLDRNETLFERHARTRLVPASNMKIVALAVAAERLGWDFTFETTIAPTAPVVNGVIDGDLVLRSTGDPSVNVRGDRASSILASWAEALWQAGVRRITGRVIGDDNAFDDRTLGDGWAWDNLAYGYSAPVGPLQVFENAVTIRLTPTSPGELAALSIDQPWAGLIVDTMVTTSAAGGTPNLSLAREPGNLVLRLTGSVPAGGEPAVLRAAVENPTVYAARAVRAALAARGIAVDGEAVDIDALPAPPGPVGPPLVIHRSPPLHDLAGPLMKASQNLYAETMLRAAGAADGLPATSERGRGAVREVLGRWGLDTSAVVVSDGSGLSRYNYLSADVLVGILKRMYQDPRHREPWTAALPVAGVDGTLEKRMRGTAAEGNARAKTGSLANTRGLSGYVRSRQGELLAFSVLVNNVVAPGPAVEAAMDAIVARLAEFER